MPPRRGGAAGGGKRAASSGGKPKKKARARNDADEVDSGDSGDDEAAAHASLMFKEAADEEAEAEPAEERRVRLAKEMLAAMDQAASRKAEQGADASGVARGAHVDSVAEALEEDAMRRAGTWRWMLASALRGSQLSADALRTMRGPRLSPTCVSISPDENFVVCGCKDGAVVRWELPDGRRTKLAGGRSQHIYGKEALQFKAARAGAAAAAAAPSAADADAANDADDADDDDTMSVGSNGIRSAGTSGAGPSGAATAPAAPSSLLGGGPPAGHLSDVLSISVSSDSRLIASGGKDNLMLLWDARTNEVVHHFKGHRGPVRALARRRDGEGPELYSASTDRTARVWDVLQRGYVETLYGHQEAISTLDALAEDMVLSGSEDRTVRLWKVAEETQLLFSNGHGAPVDACAMLHAEAFVSGAQDGSLTLWSSKRKKYLHKLSLAHGEAPWGGPCWISALASPAYSDVAISGSCDGQLRFWHAEEVEERKLKPLMSVPITGFVNGISLAPSGKFLACAVGQEHRLGRWFRIPEARNSLCLLTLPSEMHAKPKFSTVGAALGAEEEEADDDDDDDDDEEEEDSDDDLYKDDI